MPDPLSETADVAQGTLAGVFETATRELARIADRPATATVPAEVATAALPPLGATGIGALAAVRALADAAAAACTASTGPRYLDFVVGGVTPAAMGADWLVSLFDQNAAGPGSSAFATDLEGIVLAALGELFGLPAPWSGVLTTSAMTASLTGIACATRRWGLVHGVDVAEDGLSGLPPMPVLASPLVHPTVRKALQLLGHGRSRVEVWTDGDPATQIADLRRRLDRASGPALLLATAGDASTGAFDPIAELVAVAQESEAWLHVDAAFGLGVALSPRLRHHLDRLDEVDSVAADAHKWLNVPYDCGFALVRDPTALEPTFGMAAAPYLPDEPFRGYAVRGPESSRRARALPLWATLAAYGADGLAALVERIDGATQHLAAGIEACPALELACGPTWAIVCFRPAGAGDPDDRDGPTRRFVERLRADGRFAVGTTTVDGRLAVRVALVSWRLTTETVEELLEVARLALADEPSCVR